MDVLVPEAEDMTVLVEELQWSVHQMIHYDVVKVYGPKQGEEKSNMVKRPMCSKGAGEDSTINNKAQPLRTG